MATVEAAAGRAPRRGAPGTMQAVWKQKAAPGFTLASAPIPTPGPRDLLLEVRATSVCGTDVHIHAWDSWASRRLKPPIVLGHEMCGTVVDMGREVQGFAVDDFVSVESHIPCDRCPQCRTGQRHICANLQILGVDVAGSFAEYVAVPALCAWKNPPDLAPEVASTWYAAIEAQSAAAPVTCPARRSLPSDRETSGVELLLDMSALSAPSDQ